MSGLSTTDLPHTLVSVHGPVAVWSSCEMPNTKGIAVIGALVSVIGLALYPIAIHPKLFPQKYQNMQRENRKGIAQKDVQPGGMNVWTDPFKKK